ncbi:hypothetical protein Zmor_015714 [Zophobas morio]|uniref:phospholipase A2 n=1 Tax=Zophobas morio TaxID=2755281 RepID=A0AA38IK29_9CUCU|nr:hypothetical protein Zmor_015714 [Zophobas morio]
MYGDDDSSSTTAVGRCSLQESLGKVATAIEDWDEPKAPLEHSFDDEENQSNNPTSEPEDLDFIGHDKTRPPIWSNTKGLDCNKTLYGGSIQYFKSSIVAQYPVTRWCGDLDLIELFGDFEKFSKIASCCRAHDTCPENMDPDSSKYGLMNTCLFERTLCDCDKRFYECLKNDDSFGANSIGYTYFTILGPQCFKQDYPIIDCVEESGGRCEEYLTDTDGEKIYQWFDSPVY